MAALVGMVMVLVVGTSWCLSPYDATLYEDVFFQDLYKRLAQLEDTYYPVGEEGFGGGPEQWDDQGIALNSRDSGQTDIRDPEFLSHSSVNEGFQYISGGAGEGKQHLTPDGTQENHQEVKSDDILPFYCHPPNPCPKGFTADDGCQPDVDDNAETQKNWISNMQNKGMCTCDTEHMFDCPKPAGGMRGPGMGGPQNDDEMLNSVISSLLGDKSENPFGKGDKRGSIMAKKSPRIKRSAGNLEDSLASLSKTQGLTNPYLSGPKIRTVAKKGMRYQPKRPVQ